MQRLTRSSLFPGVSVAVAGDYGTTAGPPTLTNAVETTTRREKQKKQPTLAATVVSSHNIAFDPLGMGLTLQRIFNTACSFTTALPYVTPKILPQSVV